MRFNLKRSEVILGLGSFKSEIVVYGVYCRPQTTVKNARNKKSVSQAKLPFFRRDFQTLRTALSSNVHQFCKPKSSCFMRERAVKRISFFLEFLMLYEVYSNFFHAVLALSCGPAKC